MMLLRARLARMSVYSSHSRAAIVTQRSALWSPRIWAPACEQKVRHGAATAAASNPRNIGSPFHRAGGAEITQMG